MRANHDRKVRGKGYPKREPKMPCFSSQCETIKTILQACQTSPAGSKWKCESPNSDRGVGTYVRSGHKIDELRKSSNAAAARDECLCSKLTPGSGCRLRGKPQQDFVSALVVHKDPSLVRHVCSSC